MSFQVGDLVRRRGGGDWEGKDREGVITSVFVSAVDGSARVAVRFEPCKILSLPYDPDLLVLARCTEHPGCLESVEVARDCWLSRRPGALGAGT